MDDNYRIQIITPSTTLTTKWSKPLNECKKLVSTYKRQDKRMGVVNSKYNIIKA